MGEDTSDRIYIDNEGVGQGSHNKPANTVKTDAQNHWDDWTEVIQHTVRIHKKGVRNQLSDDAILFRPDDDKKLFVRRQTRISDAVYDFLNHDYNIKGSAEGEWFTSPPVITVIAENTRDNIMNDVHVVMVLDRNDPNNYLVKVLAEKSIDYHAGEDGEGKSSLVKKIQSAMGDRGGTIELVDED